MNILPTEFRVLGGMWCADVVVPGPYDWHASGTGVYRYLGQVGHSCSDSKEHQPTCLVGLWHQRSDCIPKSSVS
jgi:hypothetical protein